MRSLRREGYELQVRRPEVVLIERDGQTMEPVEELLIEIPEEYQGNVITAVSERKGELIGMEVDNGTAQITYRILTRNLIGLRSALLTLTKGNLVMNSFVTDYSPFDKDLQEPYRKGVIISSETGISAIYALNTIQERGDLFIGGSVQVYEGMIIGINKYDQDMEVNPCKEREKSGVRRNQAEITQMALRSPVKLTLEFALVFLAKDEILEGDPKSFATTQAIPD